MPAVALRCGLIIRGQKMYSVQQVTTAQREHPKSPVAAGTIAGWVAPLKIGALSVVLFIIYNFSDQFLTIRERRETRSREEAIKMARQQIRAQKHWKVAKQLLKSHVNRRQSDVPHTLGSFAQHAHRENSTHRTEETPMVPLKAQELSEASVFESEGTNEISESASSVVVISSGGGETAVTKNKCALKGKHRSTLSQRFKYAYVSIEKEKIEEQENKNLSSSSVIITGKTSSEIYHRGAPAWPCYHCHGPSGAGKTIFLSAIAGKVAGYKINGSIRVNGKNDKIRSYKKIIGFVPQDDIVHGN
ncbi:unnamed protein product [Miscanthus lutarioriparius]|uniref:ABC transporter domain-containing protein n=1 Tax=Miscanthus lutarioriparius TaxID=422564 RepID=A0A811QZG8_9POAL|nr:unnamed protein product [Miscanthus lutarioriparius]